MTDKQCPNSATGKHAYKRNDWRWDARASAFVRYCTRCFQGRQVKP